MGIQDQDQEHSCSHQWEREDAVSNGTPSKILKSTAHYQGESAPDWKGSAYLIKVRNRANKDEEERVPVPPRTAGPGQYALVHEKS